MLAFVYGTLTDPDRARAVLERDPEFAAPAVLDGCHRAEGAYPTLVPGGDCEGRLLRVERPDLHRLDAYEGVDRGLYTRVSVPFEGPVGDASAGTVETYVGAPDTLDAPGSWPGEGTLAERVQAYVENGGVVVRRLD